MRGLAEIANSLHETTGNLKCYGFGFWFAWSFAQMKVMGAASNELMQFSGVPIVSTVGILSTLIILLAFGRYWNRFLCEGRVSIALGLIGGVGAFAASVVSPGESTISWVASTSGVFLTGVVSAFFVVKTGQVFGSLPPVVTVRLILQNVLLASVIFLVLLALPDPDAVILESLLFVIAGFLLSLNDFSQVPPEDAESDYSKEVPSLNRIYLITALTIFLCSAGILYFSDRAVAWVTEIEARIAEVLSIFSIALLVCFAAKAKPLRMADWFVGVALAFPVVFAVGFITQNYYLGSLLINVYRYFALFMLYAVWAIAAFNSKSNPLLPFVVGSIVVCIADLISNAVCTELLQSLPDDYLQPMALLVVLIYFMAVLIILPKSYLREVFSIDPEEEGPSSSSDERGRPGWIDRCGAICDSHDLSPREREVFFLLAQGYNANYISDQLIVSYYTVRAHIRNIYVKLGVHSKQELFDLVDEDR